MTLLSAFVLLVKISVKISIGTLLLPCRLCTSIDRFAVLIFLPDHFLSFLNEEQVEDNHGKFVAQYWDVISVEKLHFICVWVLLPMS